MEVPVATSSEETSAERKARHGPGLGEQGTEFPSLLKEANRKREPPQILICYLLASFHARCSLIPAHEREELQGAGKERGWGQRQGTTSPTDKSVPERLGAECVGEG